MPTKPRIAIIGAGPIGLEAALYARLKGYEVTVYERGPVAGNVRRWGHVSMFSPFGMNSSEWGRAALDAAGSDLPDMDAILTGSEFVEQYLLPLSRLGEINDCLTLRTPTLKVTRAYSRKMEHIGSPARAAEPFHLLVRRLDADAKQDEDSVTVDVVLDCTGTYGNHNWLGGGGGPCPGELHSECHIKYDILSRSLTDPEQLRREQDELQRRMQPLLDRTKHELPPQGPYLGERTLLVGAGHTAATNLLALVKLHCIDERTRVLWVTRRITVPMMRIENDKLPERDLLSRFGNEVAESSPIVEWIGGHAVRSIEWNAERGRARVTLESVQDGHQHTELVDRIIANVGYRPDRSLYEELQVHECYATQGPMKLAAKLLGETSADCLDQTSHGPEVLRNPEPNFYILGMKSYGRNSNFLIQVGLQQIVDVFSLIEQDWGMS